MKIGYDERLNELFRELQLVPYHLSEENLIIGRQLIKNEIKNIFNLSKYFYLDQRSQRNNRPYKRRVFVHMHSYYLPDFIRGMTDTVNHIWINAKEYFKKFVLRHEKIHFKFPWLSEETVRELDDFYDPYLPDVEFVYL
ncbi:MAG: hypothetical protein KQA38_03755 [Candidatus Aenigmarchaeota archaeon]|nr:hypothetical protein [Candidatus Aenigmarchaeota archaeon]